MRFSRTVSVVALVAGALAMSTSPSMATPPPSTEWTNPQLLSEREGVSGLTIAPDGYAVVSVWDPTPNGCDPLHCVDSMFADVMIREPGSRWTEGDSRVAEFADVEFDDAGNGWATWLVESDRFVESPGPRRTMLSSRPAGGEWSDGEIVSSDRWSFRDRLLVTDTSVPVVWRSLPVGDSYQLETAARTSTGWVRTTRTTDSAASLRAGTSGAVRAVWVARTAQGSALVLSEQRSDGSWTADQVVLQSSPDLSDPAWIGTHAVALTTSTGGVIATEASDGSWDMRPAFPDQPAQLTAYEAAGEVTVAWLTPEGEVRARHGRVDGRWSPPRTLGRRASSVDLAVDSRGNASLFWVADDFGTRYAQRPVGAGWTATRRAPIPVDRTPDMSGVEAAAGAGGTVTVIGGSSLQQDNVSLHSADLTTPSALTRIQGEPDRGWARSTSIRVGWRTTWLRSTRHDVRYQVWTIDGRVAGTHRLASGVRADTRTLHGKAGRTYCLSARAHAGPTTGPWGEETCVSTPLDDRALSSSAAWSRAHGTSTTRSRGATLTSPRIRGSRFALLVRPSADAGTVRVTFDGRRLGTHRLVAGRPGRPRVIALDGFKRPRHGRLVVTVVSSGKPVRIDGIYAR